MNIRGTIRNGVVELDGGATLPEGMEVTVTYQLTQAATAERRVTLPLVPSAHPGSVRLTAERVAELLDDVDVSA